MKQKTLPERIDAVLNGHSMRYHDLAKLLYPDGKSWNYQANGGPPGCFMSLSAALSRGKFHVTFAQRVSDRWVRPRNNG